MNIAHTIFERCIVDPVTGCWVWQLATNNHGYPAMTYQRHQVRPRRTMLELKLGRPLEGYACHICDNRRCVNPDHLYEGDAKTNIADAVSRGRAKGQFKAGVQHPGAKLTEAQVREIRQAHSYRGVVRDLAKKFKVHTATISQVRSGRYYGSVG